MSDHIQSNPFQSPPRQIAFPGQLPAWLARRLRLKDEQITWVRGPRFNPWWERYTTHPGLFVVAFAIGALCVYVGNLVGSESQIRNRGLSEELAIAYAAAFGIVLASIFVLGISAGYFTRLVVTNHRIVIFQGYEMCRIWKIDDLPPSLVRFAAMGNGTGPRSIDLTALQALLGAKSSEFAESKTILAFGKALDSIKAGKEPRTK